MITSILAALGCAPATQMSDFEDDASVVLRRDASRDTGSANNGANDTGTAVDASAIFDALVSNDSNAPLTDASRFADRPASPDASVTPVDASVTPVDASVTPVDASVTPVDASVTPVDASVTPVDASRPADPIDASTVVDAATRGTYRVATSTVQPSSIMFDDVASDHLALPFIQRAAAFGILPRCSPTTNSFCPDRNATRREAAVAVTNAKFYGSMFTYPIAPYFMDVPLNDVGFRHIQHMRETGVAQSCRRDETMFCPETEITRSEAAVFIVRTLVGETFTSTSEPHFDDVRASDPDYRYVQKLRDLGITLGCGGRRFCPADSLPRWQLATFVSRAFFPVADAGVP